MLYNTSEVKKEAAKPLKMGQELIWDTSKEEVHLYFYNLCGLFSIYHCDTVLFKMYFSQLVSLYSEVFKSLLFALML